MHVLDYASLRDAVVDAMGREELETSIDEAVFLTSNSRGCDVIVNGADEPREVWAKIGFEWVAANQALLEALQDEDDVPQGEALAAEPGLEVMMNASFHLHFGLLAVTTDVMREVAEELNRLGQAYFGDDGGVVAEVTMTAADARLECLRFEVNASVPLATEDEWWDRLAEVCSSMLEKMQEMYRRLNSEFGSPRDSGSQ